MRRIGFPQAEDFMFLYSTCSFSVWSCVYYSLKLADYATLGNLINLDCIITFLLFIKLLISSLGGIKFKFLFFLFHCHFHHIVMRVNSVCAALQNDRAVVVGSRAHLEKESIASRSLFRTFLMKGFHLIVWLLCVRSVRDSQCGFKLFTREAARVIFFNQHVERWWEPFDFQTFVANQWAV